MKRQADSTSVSNNSISNKKPRVKKQPKLKIVLPEKTLLAKEKYGETGLFQFHKEGTLALAFSADIVYMKLSERIEQMRKMTSLLYNYSGRALSRLGYKEHVDFPLLDGSTDLFGFILNMVIDYYNQKEVCYIPPFHAPQIPYQNNNQHESTCHRLTKFHQFKRITLVCKSWRTFVLAKHAPDLFIMAQELFHSTGSFKGYRDAPPKFPLTMIYEKQNKMLDTLFCGIPHLIENLYWWSLDSDTLEVFLARLHHLFLFFSTLFFARSGLAYNLLIFDGYANRSNDYIRLGRIPGSPLGDKNVPYADRKGISVTPNPSYFVVDNTQETRNAIIDGSLEGGWHGRGAENYNAADYAVIMRREGMLHSHGGLNLKQLTAFIKELNTITI